MADMTPVDELAKLYGPIASYISRPETTAAAVSPAQQLAKEYEQRVKQFQEAQFPRYQDVVQQTSARFAPTADSVREAVMAGLGIQYGVPFGELTKQMYDKALGQAMLGAKAISGMDAKAMVGRSLEGQPVEAQIAQPKLQDMLARDYADLRSQGVENISAPPARAQPFNLPTLLEAPPVAASTTTPPTSLPTLDVSGRVLNRSGRPEDVSGRVVGSERQISPPVSEPPVPVRRTFTPSPGPLGPYTLPSTLPAPNQSRFSLGAPSQAPDYSQYFKRLMDARKSAQ